jgi:hypothetical protein
MSYTDQDLNERAEWTASTIRQQIQSGTTLDYTSGRVAMMCWAFQAPTTLPFNESDHTWGGLKFLVNGYKHKGWVSVNLTFSDDYTIRLYESDGVTLISERTNVYAPELTEVLDYMIEYSPSEELEDVS